MDPTETLIAALEALVEANNGSNPIEDIQTAIIHLHNLSTWLQRGGFVPMVERNLSADPHRSVVFTIRIAQRDQHAT